MSDGFKSVLVMTLALSVYNTVLIMGLLDEFKSLRQQLLHNRDN